MEEVLKMYSFVAMLPCTQGFISAGRPAGGRGVVS